MCPGYAWVRLCLRVADRPSETQPPRTRRNPNRPPPAHPTDLRPTHNHGLKPSENRAGRGHCERVSRVGGCPFAGKSIYPWDSAGKSTKLASRGGAQGTPSPWQSPVRALAGAARQPSNETGVETKMEESSDWTTKPPAKRPPGSPLPHEAPWFLWRGRPGSIQGLGFSRGLGVDGRRMAR